jgi:hypothetical protein
MKERILRRTPRFNTILSEGVFSQCMEQVVERTPQVLSYAPESMEGKLEFLLSVGVPKDQLGQVGTSTFV